MTLAPEIAEALAAPLDPARVQKREGSGGRMLSYLEGHDAIRTANTIFGVGEWSYEVQELTHLGTEPTENRSGKKGHRVAYRAVVRAAYNGHAFSDVGYGDATEYTGSELTPHELAAKEAVTDALKRCLKNYGDQFGLCLYDKDAPEHRGATNAGAAASASTGRTPGAAPATNGDEFRFASGKHAGKSLAEVPSDYLVWYMENGPRQDVKDAILAHTGQAPVSPAAPADDDIPFMATGDGGF